MPIDWKKGRGFVPSSRNESTSSNIVRPNMFAPPPSYQQTPNSSRSMSSADADLVTTTMQYGMNARKRVLDEDEYLEDEEPSGADLEYTPAPGSPSAATADNAEDEDEDDPLDAYMAGIEVAARKDKESSEKRAVEPSTSQKDKEAKAKLGRTDIEDEDDDQESYFQWMAENRGKAGANDEEEDDIEYDEEGNPLPRKKYIDPLPSIDHSTIKYEPFEKNFYIEHQDIAEMTRDKMDELRKTLNVRVMGPNTPKPVTSFAHFGLDEALMNAIRKSEYTQPTPIQAQGIPAAIGGRDMIGIAKTGSGKTAAYLWPALVHIMDQPELKEDDGPICLIVVPTRELAIQVYNEAKRFGKVYNLRCVCAYGGGSKWEQSKALQAGAEIVVATPGRLIDMVKLNATNLRRVTYLVFDEADRMFDLGFEAQVRSIADHVRPDRQCVMFSATFRKKIERLARDILTDPIKVIQGELGEANEDIKQIVEVMPSHARYPWLLDRLVSFCADGKVLIFVTKKQNSDELATSLKGKGYHIGLLHGDMMQHERNEVIHAFRKEDMPILVATDVAARGLDIPSIKTVVNFDIARDIDTHVHRIGRTGRAGEKGVAYTLFTDKDSKEFAGHLVRNLESVNQPVPQKLLDVAMQSPWFKKSRFKQGGARRPNIGGKGFGFKDNAASGSGDRRSGFSASSSDTGSVFSQSASSSTSASERLAAMKAAFSSHYKTVFQAASADTSWESQDRSNYTEPSSDWKNKLNIIRNQSNDADNDRKDRRKKSRWE